MGRPRGESVQCEGLSPSLAAQNTGLKEGPLRCWRRGARSPPAGGPRGWQEARPRSEHGWVVGWVTRRPLLAGRGAPDATGTEAHP